MYVHSKATHWTLPFLLALQLGAQNFGEITGTVSDVSGSVIAGAVVTVTSAATNQIRRVTTNASGDYSAPFLNPGHYEIRVQQPGFKVAMRKDVVLQV